LCETLEQGTRRANGSDLIRWFVLRGCNMAEAKDYSLDGKDRQEWDRLWGEKTLRLLPGKCMLPLRDHEFGSLKVKAVALSDDPVEFAASVWRNSELCPVCGESTAGCLRVAAHLTVEYSRPTDWPFKTEPSYWLGVWVHELCFERCQETARPAGIPW
jgi:hypothetical protein